jgi:hypothetical protein
MSRLVLKCVPHSHQNIFVGPGVVLLFGCVWCGGARGRPRLARSPGALARAALASLSLRPPFVCLWRASVRTLLVPVALCAPVAVHTAQKVRGAQPAGDKKAMHRPPRWAGGGRCVWV